MKRGDIIKTDFDPTVGHEQAGYRPAVIVSNGDFASITNMSLVCPVTNTNRQHPLHVPIGGADGVTGFIMCDQIRAVDLRKRTFKRVGEIDAATMERVEEIIKAAVSE